MSIDGSARAPERVVEPAAMTKADRLAVEAGTPIAELVADASSAIARRLGARIAGRRIAVLMGPSNNGWDGEATIPLLTSEAAEVAGFAIGRPGSTWQPLAAFDPERYDIVIDALFGGGLSRDIDGDAADAIRRLNDADVFILSVDLPSGVDGRSGAVWGIAVEADETVTFANRRPGHLLLPGREFCGRVFVEPIGLPPGALATALDGEAPLWLNTPSLWRSDLPVPMSSGHKFSRGHAVVLGGGATHSGAARLTAAAALRGGAGLVTLLAPSSALLVNASHLDAVMLRRCSNLVELGTVLEDERIGAAALGPGFGVGQPARDYALALLAKGRSLVLDADGLTSFRDDPSALFAAIAAGGPCVLTPHEGEFARLFPDLASGTDGPKHERARAAARRSGAVVVLKGADTVIAAPNGEATINSTGTPWLATAGSGDALTGLILAQLAGGMPIFGAACAGVWMHGRAAELFGPGLTAEDIAPQMPAVWRDLLG